jgi:nucleoid DNA-binding protein
MLNTKELINRARANLAYKYKPAEIEQILKIVVDTVLDATSNGEDVSIHGLGKFHARFIKGKRISNTGIAWLKDKEFNIPDRYHLGFKPSDAANRIVGKLIEKIDTKNE